MLTTFVSHPIVVVAINGGCLLNQELKEAGESLNEEELLANCIIPPYCPVFVKRNPSKFDHPVVIANTAYLNNEEWEFFGISFTATTTGMFYFLVCVP